MPTIRVEMFPGRTHAQKAALVEALTDGFVSTAGGNREALQVVLTEVEQENWAVGGTLVSDR
ncbi:MAG: 4-oxalocrotonate tautomerase [Acidimicrobiaceae bacterium]|nr:4-oxalocrotonate tautomerase [Acidimicrobiaceae bacterium]|tara:strand:+ start:1295 stop:1480 length:186 start_codon:yes stop_codon:yes gene_type:complete